MADVRWQWISAGRHLKGDDERYVPRPIGGGDDLADRVDRGLVPIVVTGPPGSGKTTEMLRATWRLRERSQNLAVHVNWFGDPAEVEPELMVFQLARHFFEEWANDVERVHPKPWLVQDVRASDPHLSQGDGRTLPAGEIARHVFEGYAAAYGIDRFALFLDGVDNMPVKRARMLLHKLLEIRDVADIIVIAGPALTNGSDAFEVVENYRIFAVPALRASVRSPGRAFFRELALKRVGDKPKPTRKVATLLGRAAELSGGLPKRFLSLLADAARYADRGDPGVKQLDPAGDDQAAGLRRLLLEGDVEALTDAAETRGLEVPADRRVRLLAQGLLLEYLEGDDAVVRPHPLIERYLG